MSQRNHYQTLGCSEEASHEDIKRAYHQQVLKFHPDKKKYFEEDVSDFHRVQEAWEMLRDPERRKLYDAELKQAKLEEESIVLFAKVIPEDLHVKDGNYAYYCQCGSEYIIESKLADVYEQFYVACDNCTLFISVHFGGCPLS